MSSETPLFMGRIGEKVPDFAADTTHGRITLYEYLGDSWGVLFSHPADFTPVCTTELGETARLLPEFTKRNVKVLGLSCEGVESHKIWVEDIKVFNKLPDVGFPIIADEDRSISRTFGMLRADDEDSAPVRALYVINPAKKVALVITYPGTTGRNFVEVLRAIDSVQMTANYDVATPVNWQPGQDVVVQPFIPTAKARETFTKGIKLVDLPSGKEYLRLTPDPSKL